MTSCKINHLFSNLSCLVSTYESNLAGKSLWLNMAVDWENEKLKRPNYFKKNISLVAFNLMNFVLIFRVPYVS